MIKHYETCSPDYPEKKLGELPQQNVEISLDDHQTVLQCVDCGAFEIKAEDKTHIILGERIRRRDNEINRLKTKIRQLEKQVEFLA